MKNSLKTGSGGILIIVTVVVLCIAVFAALSVATSYADLRIAEKWASSVESYYEADGEMQEILKKITEQNIPPEQVSAMLATDFPRAVLEDAGTAPGITILIKYTDNQSLAMVLDYAEKYNVSSYKVVSSGDFEYSGSPTDVWNGE